MIRRATAADILRIVDMGAQHHAESGAPGVFDADAFAAYARGLIEGSGVVLLSPVGHLGGVLVRAYAAPAWLQAVELWWWAADGCGGALLDAFEEWAADMGADQIVMSTVIAHRGAAVGRVLRRKGYAPKEVSYAKELRA